MIDMGWRYNLDGNPFVYTIEWAGDTDENGNPLNRFRVDGMEEGDYIQISYDNSATVGYQERTDRLYSGGTLVLTLTGTRGYEATKIWSENRTDVSEDERRRESLNSGVIRKDMKTTRKQLRCIGKTERQ